MNTKFSLKRLGAVLLSSLVISLAGSTVALATQIGPGSGLTAPNLDAPGSRMNIDNTVFPNLAAGTYDVENFKYNASVNDGNVQPFLAALTGVDMYEVLWVGPTAASLGPGIVTVPFTAGTQQFSLLSAADVYGGFNATQNILFFGAGTTDHNNPANFGLGVGSTITSFTNPDLGRSYAFEVNVTPAQNVPEPITLALIGMGLAGIGWRQRSKKAA